MHERCKRANEMLRFFLTLEQHKKWKKMKKTFVGLYVE